MSPQQMFISGALVDEDSYWKTLDVLVWMNMVMITTLTVNQK